MILLRLLTVFMEIGTFTFGGGYAAIPLIQDMVIRYGWMSVDMYTNVVAISETTPGPVMVNMATYIGSTQAGIIGSVVATIGVVVPSFVIMLLVSELLHRFMKHPKIKAVLNGIKPCMISIIGSTGIFMAITSVCGKPFKWKIDTTALIIMLILAGIVRFCHNKKKNISPILLIVAGAVCGVVLY